MGDSNSWMCDKGSKEGRKEEARACESKEDACVGEAMSRLWDWLFLTTSTSIADDMRSFKCNSS